MLILEYQATNPFVNQCSSFIENLQKIYFFSQQQQYNRMTIFSYLQITTAILRNLTQGDPFLVISTA